MVSITTLSISALVIALAYYFVQKRKRLPPGPWGLPFIGNIHNLEPQLHVSFEKWAKRYGPLTSLRFGQFRAVILGDVKVIREAFSIPAFAGRPDLKLFNFLAGGKHGVLNSEGPGWVEQRRFTLRNLRDFGFGRKSMEGLIMDEVNDVLDWMKENEGKPVSVNRKFSLAVVNALMTIMAGKRYDQEDPMLKSIVDASNESFSEGSQSGWLWFMPILLEWFPKLTGWNKIETAGLPFVKIFGDVVRDHIDSGEDNDPTDFIYAYLEEIKKTTNPNSTFFQDKGRKSLRTVLLDLYGAGSDTMTSTLAWVILYMLSHPEIQSKLQAELDSVTGKKREPSLLDRPNTPYTEAVIQETFRYSSIVPYSVIHSTTEDIEFRGYKIPKDTLIIPNLHAVHHDVDIWGDPENFRPERFLSADGRTVKKHEALIPFSVGKRICIGEALARDETYLFLTNIFYKFRALPDPADPNPKLSPDGSFTLEPKPYTVVFEKRV